MISKGIFKKFDVRGRYSEEINEEVFFRIGACFAEMMKVDEIIIGCDGRKSSASLSNSLVKGISSKGVKVIDLGLCSTPALYFAVCSLKKRAGLMITASHLGKEFNGLKFVGENAVALGENKMKGIKKQFEKNECSSEQQLGHPERLAKGPVVLSTPQGILAPPLKLYATRGRKLRMTEKYDVTPKYIAALKSFIKTPMQKMKIVVDCGGGAAALYAKDIFDNIENISPIYLLDEIDPEFTGRGSNPKEEKNRKLIAQKIKDEKADLGIMYDGDADRVYLLDNNGEVIDPNFVSAFIIEYFAASGQDKKFVADIRSSKVIEDTVENVGGDLYISPAWHTEVKKVMQKNKAIFGSETSGHYIFKDFYNIDDGLLTSLVFLQAANKGYLQKLKSFKSQYHILEENNFEIDFKNTEKILKKIEEKYKKESKKILKIDGLTMQFKNWRFNLRQSLSEPLLRLNMEADTEKLLQEKFKEISAVICLSIAKRLDTNFLGCGTRGSK